MVLESDTGRARDHASLRCQCGASPAIGKVYKTRWWAWRAFHSHGRSCSGVRPSRTASHRPRRAAERRRRSDSADDRLQLVSRPRHSRPTVTHAAHSHQCCIGLLPIRERGLPGAGGLESCASPRRTRPNRAFTNIDRDFHEFRPLSALTSGTSGEKGSSYNRVATRRTFNSLDTPGRRHQGRTGFNAQNRC